MHIHKIKKASLTNKSSSTKSLEKAQKNPILSKAKTNLTEAFEMSELMIDMDAMTDVSMSEDMYDYNIPKKDEVEQFSVWFSKAFDIENSLYVELINTNFVEHLKGEYNEQREHLVNNHKVIFEDLIEIRRDALNL